MSSLAVRHGCVILSATCRGGSAAAAGAEGVAAAAREAAVEWAAASIPGGGLEHGTVVVVQVRGMRVAEGVTIVSIENACPTSLEYLMTPVVTEGLGCCRAGLSLECQ